MLPFFLFFCYTIQVCNDFLGRFCGGPGQGRPAPDREECFFWIS